MERYRALLPLIVGGRRVEPGEVFEASVPDASDAVRLRLAEPVGPMGPTGSAKPRRKPRPKR